MALLFPQDHPAKHSQASFVLILLMFLHIGCESLRKPDRLMSGHSARQDTRPLFQLNDGVGLLLSIG